MDSVSEKKRITQQHNIEALLRNTLITEMIDVYFSEVTDTHSHSIYCALINELEVERSLKSFSWDLMHGDGYPDACVQHENDQEIVTYHRYGYRVGIEPLIIDRDFYGIRPDYKEINEEFRLFHRLYHDEKENKYYKIDDSGNEELVAIVEPHRIRIRLKEIRQFLAVKKMRLAIQFDFREFSKQSLDELALSKDDNSINQTDEACWATSFGEHANYRYNSFSRLCGKRFILPLPIEKCGMWGFAEEKQKEFSDFIIEVTDDGDVIKHSSNPDMLANNFGGNPGSPHYLTPVHFRKTVLDKYYQQPSKYSVEDNRLSCGALWAMQIDNHHPDKVCAWLGDLGRDLPECEQLHWKSHNIPPDGTVSDVYIKRHILAQFTDSDELEHIFQARYESLAEGSKKPLSWMILRPLTDKDIHHLSTLHVPATEEQSDFDAQILNLTKILVDSINEDVLKTMIPKDDLTGLTGSISRLEYVLKKLGIPDHELHIKFLRDLQNLRSSGSAHRKGSRFEKILKEMGYDSLTLINAFSQILQKSISFIEFLEKAIIDGRFNEAKSEL